MLRLLFLLIIGSIPFAVCSQTLPITPSIVTFHQQSSAWICTNLDSIEVDVNQDSIPDLVIQRWSRDTLCDTVIFRHKELQFRAGATSAILGQVGLIHNQYLASEFFISQQVVLSNYAEHKDGAFFLRQMQWNSPNNCTINQAGGFNQRPYVYHYLLADSISAFKYHYLVALQYDSSSECYRIQTPVFTSIEESFQMKPFSIYPNPNNGKFIVRSNGQKGEQISILNSYGSIIRTMSLQTDLQDIDVSDLGKGIYFIRIGNSTESLVIQ